MPNTLPESVDWKLFFKKRAIEKLFIMEYDLEQRPFYVLGVYLSYLGWFPAIITIFFVQREQMNSLILGILPLFIYLTFLIFILKRKSQIGNYQIYLFIAPIIATTTAIFLFQFKIDFEKPYIGLVAIITIQIFCIFLFRLRILFAFLLILISSTSFIVSLFIIDIPYEPFITCIAALSNFIIIMILMAYYFERSARIIFLQKMQIRREHEVSESLLLNILPAPIAERLKKNSGTIAEGFTIVTTLFADIVNFTVLAKKISPEALVNLLDRIFSEFDNLAEELGLEKIKTIGDAYMVVGGLPIPDENHRFAILDLALAMRECMDRKFAREFFQSSGTLLQLRIGIASGPVVAGIIGKKKFSYDVWGDSVNTASRMESHGVPGMIQVTDDIYLNSKDNYEFMDQGILEIKGKGPMQTWLLLSRKNN